MSFDSTTRLLREWPNIQNKLLEGEVSESQTEKRLLQVLRNDPASHPMDLVALVRQFLREEVERHFCSEDQGSGEFEIDRPSSGSPFNRVTVPKGSGWPDAALWSKAGMKVTEQSSSFILESEIWRPEWLPGAQQHPPLQQTMRGCLLRPQSPIPIDPVIPSVLGESWRSYQCEGQRTAIHATFFSPPKTTLLVILPTGTGKSLIAYSAALIGPPHKVTLVIVPTIALALDQEEQFRDVLSKSRSTHANNHNNYAYYSELPEDSKKDILQALCSGKQQILFTSPESLEGRLNRAIHEAAENGFLRYFVVDEAHMINQWGNDFRPSFQTIANVRDSLLRSCPEGYSFRTLLLSATVTKDSFNTLKAFFGEEMETVHAAHLRPEPSFWFKECQNESKKETYLEEAIFFLPRPWILYLSKREDAERWYRWLQKKGIKRVARMTGETPTNERRDILKRWKNRETDIMVATSAFGLGVDLPEVRAVVHACIPETIDRYYQEVGRGGRDGRACISLVLWVDPADKNIALRLNKQTMIGIGKGLERWKTLFAYKELEGDLYRIDLRCKPKYLYRASQHNIDWNQRTLNLMAQAKLIELVHQPLPKLTQQENENDDAYALRKQDVLDRHIYSAFVKIKNVDHQSFTVWKDKIQPLRQQILEANKQSLDDFLNILRETKRVSSALRSAYLIDDKSIYVAPDEVGGTCPVSRKCGVEEKMWRFPSPQISFRQTHQILPVSLIKLANNNECNTLFIHYAPLSILTTTPRREASEKHQVFFSRIQKLLEQLARLGIQEFSVDDAWKKELQLSALSSCSPHHFSVISSSDKEDHLLQFSRVSCVSSLTEKDTLPFDETEFERPLHIILFPEYMKERSPRGNRFRDVHSTLSLSDFMERLEK